MPQRNREMINWFEKAAELTEASMKAAAEVQLAALDQWMEAMTGAANVARKQGEEGFQSIQSGQRFVAQAIERQPAQSRPAESRRDSSTETEQRDSEPKKARSNLRKAAHRAGGGSAGRARNSTKAGAKARTKARAKTKTRKR